MAGKKKQLDAKAKAKRQKVIAGGLCLVLVGVLAFQLPRMMKLAHHGSSSSSAATTSTTATAAASGAAAAAAGASSLASLAHVGVKFSAEDGQLTSFNRFAAKDPFAQQMTASTTQSSSAPSGASLPSPPVTTPAPKPGLIPAPSTSTPSAGSSGGSSSSTPTSAVILVNGQSENVSGPSYNFPASDPIFHARIEKRDVDVTIVGGSFASGAPALTLKLHKPVTLVNTATGIRYRLELVSLSNSSAPTN
jgi:hypothetical protein